MIEDKKPTEAQIKEFWEKLDVALEHQWENEIYGFEVTGGCFCERCGTNDIYPSAENKCYPPLDLNNLFKYAVPKLPRQAESYSPEINLYLCNNKWGCYIRDDYIHYWVSDNPALALFWAIWGAIHDRR